MPAYRWAKEFNDQMRDVTIDTSKVKADVVGQVINKLNDQHGEATPESLLEVSRPPRSKTHKLFNWDDTEAAERYRLSQARLILRNIVYTVKVTGGEKREVRGFSSVRDDGDGRKRVYKPTERIMETRTGRDSVLQDALNGLCQWRRKWATLNELADIIPLTDEAVSAIESKIASNGS